MKKSLFSKILLAIIVSISVISCSKSPKSKEADLNDAKQDLERSRRSRGS
ncbi:MAG: hypothetical protein K9I35_03330 [Flavobacterium sp.]|nr:hypothetical protein [Flavobacterium sp.]